MDKERSHPRHIALLPSPGMGRLTPFAELATRLALGHGFSVTLITFPGPQVQNTLLHSLPTSITSLTLPPVPLDDLPSGTNVEDRLHATISRSVPALRDALTTLKTTTHLMALVADLFGADAISTARELGLRAYLFYSSSLFALSFMLHLPALHGATSCEFRELTEPVRLPGCFPLCGKDLIDPVQDRSSKAYSWVLRLADSYRETDGILVNSFEDLEPGAVKALNEAEPGMPPIYPVGPLIGARLTENATDKTWCMEWLDQQPHGSVLYVSFGSGGTLSTAQLTELVFGLELGGQRFLWVARSPSDAAANSAFFTALSAHDPFAFLPEGFEDRTKSFGLVVPSWAPQIQVLNHPSTGGFLSHCGWNSTLESVALGLPMIAWPLFAEQRMNAILLAEDAKVALRPKAGEDGLVGREEVAMAVKALMEGEEGKALRHRVQQLREAAAKALVAEEGSSYKALAKVTSKWKDSVAITIDAREISSSGCNVKSCCNTTVTDDMHRIEGEE